MRISPLSLPFQLDSTSATQIAEFARLTTTQVLANAQDSAAHVAGVLRLAAAAQALTLASFDVIAARAQSVRHPFFPGACIFGIPSRDRVCPNWAAWVNTAGVSALLTAKESPLAAVSAQQFEELQQQVAATPAVVLLQPILAVSQQMTLSGSDVLRGVAAATELFAALNESVDPEEAPALQQQFMGLAMVAGIGAAMVLGTAELASALQNMSWLTGSSSAANTDTASWPSFAAAHLAKQAVDAIDFGMRGASAPQVLASASGPLSISELEVRQALGRVPAYEGEAFLAVTASVIDEAEGRRFLEACDATARMHSGELDRLTCTVSANKLNNAASRPGIY